MAESSIMRRYYWSLRREIWETPSIWAAPAAAALLALAGYVISMLRMPGTSPVAGVMLREPFDFTAGLIMASTTVVALFYCLDALYGERRDRSVLFWKSLPVSDAVTVAAKATIPLVVLPLIATVVTVATVLVMLLVGKATMDAQPPILRTAWLMLYHMFMVHSLWWAPFFGWLLLISAWSRRAPLVWAVLPVVAVSIVERIAFNTSHFAGMLRHRLIVSPDAVVAQGRMPIDPGTHLTPGLFLASPQLWLGVGFTIALLALAVRLRRQRGPL